MNKVVVVYSGGLDSTVLLTKCKQEYDEVIALNFDYGSKHNFAERVAARKIANQLEVIYYEYDIPTICRGGEPHKFVHTVDFLRSDLLESGGEIPTEEYNAENMKSTVVPFRNGIMLSLAAGFAESRGFDRIAIANHAGDHAIYADCRPGFIKSCRETIKRGTDKRIVLHAPFQYLTKAEIVKLGSEIGAPMELTWSCYKGEEYHCGLCGTCRERMDAFKLAGVSDPTEYILTSSNGEHLRTTQQLIENKRYNHS